MNSAAWLRMLKDGWQEVTSSLTITLIVSFLVLMFLCDYIEKHYKLRQDPNPRSLLFVLYEYNVRRFFPSQDKHTHDTLFRGVESILRPGVSRAGIITLVSIGRGAGCTAASLSHSLAAVIMKLLSPFGLAPPSKYTLNGWHFTLPQDFGIFNKKLISYLRMYKVAVVTGFECLHPQIATLLSTLANEPIYELPQGVVLVIIDTGERFSISDTNRSRQIGQIALRECLGPFLERGELDTLTDTLIWRSCLVLNEPSHKPSACLVCNPSIRPTS